LPHYFSTDDELAYSSPPDLDQVADQSNGRPRQTLKWMKPSEAFDQLAATTA